MAGYQGFRAFTGGWLVVGVSLRVVCDRVSPEITVKLFLHRTLERRRAGGVQHRAAAM